MVVEQQLQQQEIRSSCSGRTVAAITVAVSKIAFAVTVVTAAERSEQVKAQQQTAGLQWWIDDAVLSVILLRACLTMHTSARKEAEGDNEKEQEHDAKGLDRWFDCCWCWSSQNDGLLDWWY